MTLANSITWRMFLRSSSIVAVFDIFLRECSRKLLVRIVLVLQVREGRLKNIAIKSQAHVHATLRGVPLSTVEI